MKTFNELGIQIPEILLPSNNNIEKWAVVACDQYTQDKEYWKNVEEITKDNPSSLNIIFPEVYLNEENKQERIAKIAGGVAVLHIGAPSEVEMKEKKDRFDDALHATRAAVEEGIIPGGGTAYIRAIESLSAIKPENEDEKLGVEIIRRAVEEPLRQIVANAGLEGSVIVNKVKEILIEEYLIGESATVGVLEREVDGKIETFATPILGFKTKTEWYDYEAKYTKGMTEFILPAELSPEMTEKVKHNAVKAFQVCGCSGVSRVDFLIVNDIPYILEINTNPGMTDTSDLPAQAAAGGIDYDALVDMILHSAGLNK